MSIYDPVLEPVGKIIPQKTRRKIFEALFKETNDYKLHVELGHMEMMDIFERHPEEGWYYHPAVALAWKFYELGAK